MMKAWISEQNVCTLRDINNRCGTEAANFYTELQSTVFEPMFPVLCDLPPGEIIDSVEPFAVIPLPHPSKTVVTSTTPRPLRRITLKKPNAAENRLIPVTIGSRPGKVLFIEKNINNLLSITEYQRNLDRNTQKIHLFQMDPKCQ
jgi:hypothetical protein